MNKFSSKYGDILTMVLIVVIVVILGIVGYFAFDVYNQNTKNANAQAALAEFEQATQTVKKKPKNKVQDNPVVEEATNETYVPTQEEIQNQIEAMENASQGENIVEETTEEPEKVMYEGYEVKGKISIPKTKCEYPVLSEVTKRSLEVAVAILYGPGLNEPGNTVIVGHNYRNGMFFSNNSKLAIGDLIYITSATETVTYEIYNMYQTSPDDASYMKRDTGGAREISLSTCTNDSSARIIIWAKEQQ